MLKIKITGPKEPRYRQLPGGNGFWKDVYFIYNDSSVKECDFWFICDSDGFEEDSEAICPENHVFFVMGEAEPIHVYDKKFVRQFPNLITVQKINYHVSHVIHDYTPGWFVGMRFEKDGVYVNEDCTYDTLSIMPPPRKTKLLSVIASNKAMCEGHKQRREFAYHLKDCFGDKVDVFGRGIRSFEDKWDVLLPYKYHVAIENYATDDYITEKLQDPFLAWCYPIYYGAPNVDKYYNHDAYTLIDIYNPDQSIKIIEELLECDPYDQKVQFIKEAREKVLNEENFFIKLYQYTKMIPSGGVPAKISIHTEVWYSWKFRLKKQFPALYRAYKTIRS